MASRRPSTQTSFNLGGDNANAEQSRTSILRTGHVSVPGRPSCFKASGGYKRRMLVLTKHALHWFKEDDEDASGAGDKAPKLFGIERGCITKDKMDSKPAGIANSNSHAFEVRYDLNGQTLTKIFQCSGESAGQLCEEWVSAINSIADDNSHSTSNDQVLPESSPEKVSVTLVTNNVKKTNIEVVLSRDPEWNRPIEVRDFRKGDKISISTSNGGCTTCSYEVARKWLENAGDNDDVPPQKLKLNKITLASNIEIKFQLLKDAVASDSSSNSNSPSMSKGGMNVDSGSNGVAYRSTSLQDNADLVDENSWYKSVLKDRRHPFTLILIIKLLMSKIVNIYEIKADNILFYIFSLLLCAQALSYVFYDKSKNGSSIGFLDFLGIKFNFSDNAPTSSADDAVLASSASPAHSFDTAQQAEAFDLEQNPSMSFNLILLQHSWTSVEHEHSFDIEEEDERIPQRFINGTKFPNGDENLKEAKRRWDLTKAFRKKEKIDDILNTKQDFFSDIKGLYPHYLAGKGKEGHLIYWERPGDIKLDRLQLMGVTVDVLLKHWLFITEYQWNVAAKRDNRYPDPEMAKSITVIDLENIALANFSGATKEFTMKSVQYANHHYPERSQFIYVVNAPWYFTTIWAFIKPFVHANTLKKVIICSKSNTLHELEKKIDRDQIPFYYGGGLVCGDTAEQRSSRDCCRFHSPEVSLMNDYVKALNDGVNMKEWRMALEEGKLHEYLESLKIENEKGANGSPVVTTINSSMSASGGSASKPTIPSDSPTRLRSPSTAIDSPSPQRSSALDAKAETPSITPVRLASNSNNNNINININSNSNSNNSNYKNNNNSNSNNDTGINNSSRNISSNNNSNNNNINSSSNNSKVASSSPSPSTPIVSTSTNAGATTRSTSNSPLPNASSIPPSSSKSVASNLSPALAKVDTR